MRMAWMMIWKHGSVARPRDAFADPLEAEEWRGLEWTDRLFTWLTRGPRPARPNCPVDQTRSPAFTR